MGDTPPANVGLTDSAGVTLAGQIMVGTIVTLFIVVVIILCIHIYTRVFIFRRSGGARRTFTIATGGDDGVGVATGRSMRRGLDKAVLKALPVVVFSVEEFKDGLECAVCLAEVVDGETARVLPNCKHGFHVGCIDMWLQSHSNCPLCRSAIGAEAADQVVESENSASTTADGRATEAVNFPTNVLFWGNEVHLQLSSMPVNAEEGTSGRPEGSLAIDIPRDDLCHDCSSSGMRPSDQDQELRSPLSSRLRSFSRLWSMNKKVAPSSSSASNDVEQGDGRV